MSKILNLSLPSRSIARRLALLCLTLVVGGLAAPAAHAQWAVNDEQANKKLQQIVDSVGNPDGEGKTVNTNLDLIRQKMSIGAFPDKRPGERVPDPNPKLPGKDAAEATLVKDKSSCQNFPQAQRANCEKIIDIQNAQYKFMVTMYETSATRDAMLREIIADRKNINPNDKNSLGKIEDNTNQLTALYNLIALDQQQMQTVNYAYDANLKYLREQQAQLSRAANTGRSSGSGFTLPGVGDIDLSGAISGLAAGSVLKTALDGKQSPKPDNLQTLHITSGW